MGIGDYWSHRVRSSLRFNFGETYLVFELNNYYSKYENQQVVYSVTTYRFLLMINWKLSVHWLNMLIFWVTVVADVIYRSIQRRMACSSGLIIPKYTKSVAWLYLIIYAHIYIDTYMYSRIWIIVMVTDCMSTLWYHLPFIIYITLQVSVCIIQYVFILWFWFLNAMYHILPFY